MSAPPLPFDRDRLRKILPADSLVGCAIQVFAETGSTNDLARRAGEAGAAEGLVFFAESQRAGRGRRGRIWSSPPGSGILLSVLLRPPAPRQQWSRLTLLATRAIIESLSETGVPTNWKWPNDVVVGSGKLAGIRVEATSEFAVLGLGLNVRQRAADFPEEVRGRALSVEMITGSGINRESLAGAILARMDSLYRTAWDEATFASTLHYCSERAALQPPRAIRLFAGGSWLSGTLLGYTSEGHLRLEHDGHEQVVADGLLEEMVA